MLTPDELALLEAELEELKRRRERVAADLDSIRDTVGDLVDADAADQIGLADELTAIDDRIAELNWHLHGGRPESEVPGQLPDGTEVTLRFPDGELVHLRVVAIVGETPQGPQQSSWWRPGNPTKSLGARAQPASCVKISRRAWPRARRTYPCRGVLAAHLPGG
jgi:transcription elongation GreA/GreB family factor